MPSANQTLKNAMPMERMVPSGMTDKTRRKPRNFNGSGEAGLLLGLSPPSGFARQQKNESGEND
jgi:hypothetical protein